MPINRTRPLLPRILRRLRAEAKLVGLKATRRLTVRGHPYRLRNSHPSGLMRAAAFADIYEPGHDIIIQTLLDAKPGVFVDVGANVGQTLLKLLNVSRERSYIGFEPQLSAALDVEQFIRDNDLKSHIILPLGIANKPGILKLGTRFANDTGASLTHDVRPTEFFDNFNHVPVNSGDDILAQLDVAEVCLIKIDVEGAELEVMKGFAKTLDEQRPSIIFECLPKILRTTGERLNETFVAARASRNRKIAEFLTAKSYTLYQLSDDGPIMEKVIDLLADETEVLNFVAVPVEAADDIEALLHAANDC